MARLEVIEAFEDKLLAEWTTLPFRESGVSGNMPEDGSAFITMQYPYSEEAYVSIGNPGNNLNREEGGVRIAVYLERGRSIKVAAQYAKEIAAIFRNKSFDGVRTMEVTSPVYDDDIDNGAYLIAALVVLYQHDMNA